MFLLPLSSWGKGKQLLLQLGQKLNWDISHIFLLPSGLVESD